jgi:hypothetical protein
LPASAQQFDASATGGPTQLDAPWRLHFGEDAAFAQPGFDDSQWMECPAFFEPVGMIETGVQGAKDGETEESYP